MRTTLNLPDDLMRAVKVLAAEQNRTLQAVIAELLRKGLAHPRQTQKQTVELPLVQCPRSFELTPDDVADILLEQEGA